MDSASTEAAPPSPTAPCPGEVVRWLLGEGRRLGDVALLLDGLCRRLAAAGVPLSRGVLGMPLLHPQLRFLSCYWRRDEPAVEVVGREHGTETSAEYLASPVAAIIERRTDAMRFRLEAMEPPWPYPVLGELRDQGATDYVLKALPFSEGRPNLASFATDRAGGFGAGDLALIDGVLPALGAVLEPLVLRRLAATVLDTYVGRRTGGRILSGEIRRGTGAEVRAVLWFCDLRGFTPLADRLPRDELIALLNGYFEIMGGAVEEQGGEILKFIGDAMLAIMPLETGCREEQVCHKALDAAESALAGMARLNAGRAAWGQPTLRSGIALHVGDVMYGNIGAPHRLDFTVIGPAVNLVSRIEGLCRDLDRPLLTSAAFAAACRDRLVPLGRHRVRGVEEPVEVWGMGEAG